MSTDEIAAREAIIQAVLRRLSGERDRPHAYQDADLEYADDMLLDAARDLVKAAGVGPIEWGVRFPNGVVNVHPNQNDALAEAQDYGGDVVTRTVGAWVEKAS